MVAAALNVKKSSDHMQLAALLNWRYKITIQVSFAHAKSKRMIRRII